jgi:hypothetical protein
MTGSLAHPSGQVVERYRWAIPAIYAHAGNFQDGLAPVAISKGSDSYDYKYGYIDRSGAFVIQPQFDFAYSFTDGVALVGYCGPLTKERALHREWRCKYGYIEKDGSFLINPQFDYADSFFRGWARVQNRIGDDEWGPVFYVDKQGNATDVPPYEIEIKPKLKKVADGLLVSSAFTYDTSSSNFLAGLHPREIRDQLRRFHISDRFIQVTQVGYVDLLGNVVIRPQFRVGWEFSEGLAAVEIEHAGYGYIDTAGKLVIPPQFLFGGKFNSGLADVSVKMGVNEFAKGVIDRTGRFVILPNSNWEYVDTCCEGLMRVKLKKEGMYGFISVD